VLTIKTRITVFPEIVLPLELVLLPQIILPFGGGLKNSTPVSTIIGNTLCL